MNRRKFIELGGLSVTGGLLAACNANPKKAQKLLSLAEVQNEKVERGVIFRHSSMDHAKQGQAAAGNAFPSYHIAHDVPVWNEAQRGVWRLEVTGAVKRPLSLTLADL